MTLPCRHIASTLTALALSAGLCTAEVMTVETTGQAVATGAKSDAHLHKSALQEALYQAALKGGAQVSGYAALSHSVLTSDVLVIRPDAKILDYAILSEETNAQKSSVTIRAVVGSLDTPPACARRAALTIAPTPPDVDLSPQAPAWLNDLQTRMTAALSQALTKVDGVTSAPAPAPVAATRQNTGVAAEFDYVALTRGIDPNTNTTTNTGHTTGHNTGSGGLPLRTMIKIGAPENTGLSRVLPVDVTLFLTDPSQAVPLRRNQSLNIKLRANTPWQVLNARSLSTRDAVIGQITGAATQMVDDMIDARACQPLAGPLQWANGTLRLPFGRKDGLSRHHLAYTQGRDTPYEILEITKLNDHSVQMRPMDRRRDPSGMAGLTVQFMELK